MANKISAKGGTHAEQDLHLMHVLQGGADFDSTGANGVGPGLIGQEKGPPVIAPLVPETQNSNSGEERLAVFFA